MTSLTYFHVTIVLLCRDICAAFDATDYSILLDCISHVFGVRGVAFSWLQLSDQKLYIAIGPEKFSSASGMSGVPWGSGCMVAVQSAL